MLSSPTPLLMFIQFFKKNADRCQRTPGVAFPLIHRLHWISQTCWLDQLLYLLASSTSIREFLFQLDADLLNCFQHPHLLALKALCVVLADGRIAAPDKLIHDICFEFLRWDYHNFKGQQLTVNEPWEMLFAKTHWDDVAEHLAMQYFFEYVGFHTQRTFEHCPCSSEETTTLFHIRSLESIGDLIVSTEQSHRCIGEFHFFLSFPLISGFCCFLFDLWLKGYLLTLVVFFFLEFDRWTGCDNTELFNCSSYLASDSGFQFRWSSTWAWSRSVTWNSSPDADLCGWVGVQTSWSHLSAISRSFPALSSSTRQFMDFGRQYQGHFSCGQLTWDGASSFVCSLWKSLKLKLQQKKNKQKKNPYFFQQYVMFEIVYHFCLRQFKQLMSIGYKQVLKVFVKVGFISKNFINFCQLVDMNRPFWLTDFCLFLTDKKSFQKLFWCHLHYKKKLNFSCLEVFKNTSIGYKRIWSDTFRSFLSLFHSIS